MSVGVFFAILGAAILHAIWNALVKVSADRLSLMAIFNAGTFLIALAFVPFVDIPPAVAWPHILASTFIHTGYFLFLILSYRYGDLSHVYPLSRGTAPLIVALLAFIFIGEALSGQALLAVFLISMGIMSMVLIKGAEGVRQPKAIAAALATAGFIACYTMIDGTGARLSTSASSYILWLNIFNGLPIIVIALIARRGQIRSQFGKLWKAGFLSGGVSLLAYWIVLWAATQAPLAMVAAVRETSMVFAILFGVFFLKERLDLRRLFSAFVTLSGTVLLKFSR
ncbi:MAG: DMT family transporter [Sneathiella sp.]|uniref:DMT family transporter n=1 Tax=Sneathiella sp. TaxID=1964365 RepID=UPI0030032070